MKVVGEAVLAKAKMDHGDLDGPLSAWLKIAQAEKWTCLNDLRKTLPNTDAPLGISVFNIKGNSYRLIANINYKSQLLIIREVLTHAEYDKGVWKKWAPKQ